MRADSLQKALECAKKQGLGTPNLICNYEVLLYSSTGKVTAFKDAKSEKAVVECAKNTECTNCTATVTQTTTCRSSRKHAPMSRSDAAFRGGCAVELPL
ncbi:MAG: hypothetical protein ACREXY_07095 [Gammaproteobacteria bacterium]